MTLTIGTRLGPYEIVDLLGAGGMGEVYRATDTRLNRTVAIKVLPARFSVDQSLRDRFEREARAISQLTHPHVCTLYDVGRHEGIDFLVMEFLEGETLTARLSRGPLTMEEVVRIATEVAEALDRAHRQGIVHRDLKPGNVMLTKTGAKLLDFGLARIGVSSDAAGVTSLPTSPAPLTQQGAVLGTFQYMSPEQLEGRDADARSDIFAFGALIYEMATGHKAFEGKSQASVIAAILERQPAALSSLAPSAPIELDRLVTACLAKDPNERIQTAHDILLQLRWIGATTDAGVPRNRGKETSLSSRTRTMAFAVTMVFAVTAAGAAGWFLKSRDVVPNATTRFVVAPPNNRPIVGGGRTNLTVSPDGRMLAFLVDPGSRIYLQPLNEFQGQVLAGTDGASTPFFSPDGQWIGFVSSGQLKKISIRGGTPLTVGQVAAQVSAPTWLDDGSVVWPSGAGALMRLPPTGGASETIVEVGAGERVRTSYYVPGSDVLLFAVQLAGRGSHVEALNLRTRERRVLIDSGNRPHYVASGHLLYAEADALLAAPFDIRTLSLTGQPIRLAENLARTVPGDAWFGASPAGTVVYSSGISEQPRSLVWLDRKGVELQPIAAPSHYYEQPRLSPDGTRIAVATRDSNAQDVGVIDPGRGTFQRLSFGAGEDETPVWSPDGRRLFYKADPQTTSSKASDGSGAEQPLANAPALQNANVHVASASPDGKHLAINGLPGTTGEDILIVTIDGSAPIRPFAQSAFNETSPMFSPDGQWIAYVSDESGRDQVYVQPFPGPGGKWQVSADGGTEPVWARNGREIFYRNERKMIVVPVQTTPTFIPGAAQLLFEGDFEEAHRKHPNYDVAPDGRFVMIKSQQRDDAPKLHIIMNLGTELLERVPRAR